MHRFDAALASASRRTPSLSFRRRVCHPKTRGRVALLGPCFKTGRMEPRFANRQTQLSSYLSVEDSRVPALQAVLGHVAGRPSGEPALPVGEPASSDQK